ncbi:MAG: M12 family metallopeptidase [Solirubrobacteraceae bacterium]|nr:M12 family metallopeptidase [Solirubrobacteraceae bacterium]
MRPAFAVAALALVLSAACATPAQAYRYDGPRWPGRTITYHNATGYTTAVRAAVRAWNSSGVRMRFRAVSRRNARVLITGGHGEGCRGVAQVGFHRGRRAPVRLGRGCAYESLMTHVVAHELGHILGLDHENRTCAVMNGSGVERCGSQPAFHFRCRVLERDDVRGAVRRYGGRVGTVRRDPFCPVFGPPAASLGLTLGLAADGAVAAGLTIPAPQRFVGDAGPTIFIRLAVYRYAGACPAVAAEGPPLIVTGADYGPQVTPVDYPPGPGVWCYAFAVQDVGGRRGPVATASIAVPPRGTVHQTTRGATGG